MRFPDLAVGEAATIDFEAVTSIIPQAMQICDDILQ
jgi:hypothetical protein